MLAQPTWRWLAGQWEGTNDGLFCWWVCGWCGVQASGSAELRRVEEQLSRIAARIDRAKLALHLPAVKGYRCGF